MYTQNATRRITPAYAAMPYKAIGRKMQADMPPRMRGYAITSPQRSANA